MQSKSSTLRAFFPRRRRRNISNSKIYVYARRDKKKSHDSKSMPEQRGERYSFLWNSDQVKSCFFLFFFSSLQLLCLVASSIAAIALLCFSLFFLWDYRETRQSSLNSSSRVSSSYRGWPPFSISHRRSVMSGKIHSSRTFNKKK